MKIGLYGLPTAGKNYILDQISNITVLYGSSLLKEYFPDFHLLSEKEKCNARIYLAKKLQDRDSFIMDGHYAFGDNVVFTDADGELYDSFVYLCVDPHILKDRMNASERNKKYLSYDIEKWQKDEIAGLRQYCMNHNKDFYVIDNPEKGFFEDSAIVLEFIDAIINGYSCVNYAKQCVSVIINKFEKEECIVLSDGDRTLLLQDSSRLIGYSTHLFDGNYYTGFQAWRHHRDLHEYLKNKHEKIDFQILEFDEKIKAALQKEGVILTSGDEKIWSMISERFQIPYFGGNEMSADTKFFITKFLRDAGKKVVAYGDSLNDYYMLKKADKGFLVTKADGQKSRSLQGKNLEGITIVCNRKE